MLNVNSSISSFAPVKFKGMQNTQQNQSISNTSPSKMATEKLSEAELKEIKAEIKSLEEDLDYQMKHPPTKDKYPAYDTDWAYYSIKMDTIQKRIAELRKQCPLDRTNKEDVLMSSPMYFFEPKKADNIKGQGITFAQNVPVDDEVALAKATYNAVPIFTNARTIKDMINIGDRDGINIELLKLDDGKYHTAIKNIWHTGSLTDPKGYFTIDRPGVVMQYGKFPANDEYVNKEWGAKNQDENGQIMDCAVIANSPDVAILNKSYVHKGGKPITFADMTRWGGFPAHKDPNAIVNAVAYDSEKEFNTLEGPIKTDVTMGDVEGYTYNDFKELKKQITKSKIKDNPNDPNSKAFVDLIMAKTDEKDTEALELLKKVTRETAPKQK